MSFDITFDSDNPLNIGFQNPKSLNVTFGETSGNVSIFYDTKENWDRQTMLIARRKAIYVYSNYTYLEDEVGNRTPVPAIKIGDGTSYLIDMPFVSDDIRHILMEHIAADGIHVTEEDRRRWDNKVTAYIDSNVPERMILSKL